MAQGAGKRERHLWLLGGRVALASAALATAAMLGGTALADELMADPVDGTADVVVLDVPTMWTGLEVLDREREQRGRHDGVVHARKGADDPPGDNRHGRSKDDGALHARRGADDPPGDNRGGHGRDDGANHA